MLPTCLKCDKKISLSWFNFSFHWTRYRCVKCGALHEWSPRRRLIGGIVGGSSVVLVTLLNIFVHSYLLSGFIVFFGVIFLLLLYPEQHRLASDQVMHNQALKEDNDSSAS